jgi:Matrixin
MKRISLPFIGVVAAVLAMAATRPTTVRRWIAIPTVRNESAGGTVLPAFRNPGRDDDETRQIAKAKLRYGEAGTYIPEILLERDSALARWHDRPLVPVTVWVQSAPELSDWDRDYVESVASAFRAWDAVELPIRFKVIPDSATAEVHVTWIDRFDAPISGRTRWSRDDNWWIVNASIVLAIHHQQGEVLDKAAMKAMALHEVGHLLGLDHTTDPGMIMAPRVRVRNLTDKDKATIRLLYSVPAGPLR